MTGRRSAPTLTNYTAILETGVLQSLWPVPLAAGLNVMRVPVARFSVTILDIYRVRRGLKWPKAGVDLTKPRRDLVKSDADLVKSRRDLVKSDADLVKSRRDLVKSDVDLVKSRRDLVKSGGESVKSLANFRQHLRICWGF
jgi:hypothetical protein